MRHRLTRSLVLLIFVTVDHIANVAAKYHHIKLRHGRHRRQHADGYLPSSFVLDTNEPERGSWGPWSVPSSCSRSCGGGVAHQTRQCLEVDDNGNERCTGSKKRFFSCNIQDCPSGSIDFRTEQCARYNKVPGPYNDWIPYTGGPNKCELNCMPRGEHFFNRFASTVIDGTPCDLEGNDVCAEGKCLPVGCDKMLGSDAREDACRECGGDGSDCNTVNGVFDANDLQYGYIDTLLIPQGATNIIVRELSPSYNYLAVRNTTGHYYLNGNWKIDYPRSLRFAGTIFHYEKETQGFAARDIITALGPTSEAIYIVLLYQDRNVGVHYEYSIPKKFSQQSDPDSYTWVADEFSECSSTCGGGFKSRRVSCVRRRDNEPADEHLCDRQLEPDDTQACGYEPCPPEWVEGEWGPCSKQCGEGGTRTRQVKCEQILAGGIPSIVEDSQCLSTVGPKNDTSEKCNEDVDCPQWHIGPWKPCDHLCGPGKQTRRVTCYKKNMETGKIEVLDDSACTEEPMPEKEMDCEVRPCAGVDWIVSEWSGCDDKCGLTQETRTAHCATQDGKTYPDDKCDPDKKPELTRECDTSKGCDYQWYTSQWSECSAKCGKGLKSRKVFCATFADDDTLKKVPNEKCDATNKFNETEECEAEISECKGEWFAGPWSKCSKACGGGDTTRKVICLKDGVTVPTSNCDYSTIMFASESCNEFTCGEDEIIPVEPVTGKMPTKDEDEDEEECEVWEDEDSDFVTFNSSLGSESAEITVSGETLSPFDTESTDYTSFDDLMQSDGPNRGDITPMVTGSGEGSGYGSGDGDYTGDILSSIYTSSSYSTADMSSVEGSGATTDEIFTEDDLLSSSEGTTENSSSKESEKSDSSSESSQSITTISSSSVSVVSESDEKASTEKASSVSSSSDLPEVSSPSPNVSENADSSSSTDSSSSSDLWKTSESSSTESSSDSSEASANSDSSNTTPEITTLFNTDLSSDFSTSSSLSSESSELTDFTVSPSSPGWTDTSITDTTESSSTDVSENTSSSDNTESTESTSSTESTESTENTESTESTESTVSTESTESTEITESTESNETDVTSPSSETTQVFESTTTSSTTDETTGKELEVDTPKIEPPIDGDDEDLTTEPSTSTTGVSIGDDSTTVGYSEESSSTGSTDDLSTVETATTELSDSSTETSETSESEVTSESSTTESSSTDESSTTETEISTESGATEESAATTETELSTESSASSESDATSTESDLTTESGVPTESTEFPESTESTSEAVTLSTMIESSGSTETEESTVSGETTTEGLTETTSSDLTTESSDDWDDLTEQTHITDFWTTISPVDAAITREHKLRKCKIPKKKRCKTSEFGCCYDGVTPAQGPFDKGCPTPKTCDETKYGCCPDGVSPAIGDKNEGCPFSHCNETLFGCCPDGLSVAEGNDFEGCKKPCNETEFGCCPDNETPADGKDYFGCCNTTTYGCCPNGIKPAIGADYEGCEEEETTLFTSVTDFETEEYITTTPSGEIEDCVNTTYGCCPNGRKIATGENFEGCGVIDKDNCTASYFGCCPDGTSPALGPDNYGCRTLCENTPYGCCPDNSTPAHGLDLEGCCLTSQFGCCPDDITPARGPDFYGCGCEYSRFRCCPDNTTAARGPDNEGCGCQYTPHGCCPNRFTPANGPNFEGCPCYTYQFGCCPDGVTVARGPHSQGCGCENTEFKCCSDGRTPAKGPNFAGCQCDSSKYGCCPDGVEEAQGENFEGCLKVPSEPGNDCALPKDRGTCGDYTVNWFFDTEYGGCTRFWYGGCEGNGNRFKTQDECKDVCVSPKGKDACYLPKISGPCEGYHPTWYYDTERKQCGQFIYGGCLGNANRFESRDKCEELCVPPTDVDPCDQPKEVGPCEGNFTRWYFNKERQVCESFIYGGCKANDNNYPTEIACNQQCLQPGHHRVTAIAQNECAIARDPGPCPGSLLRWYYDATLRACRQFVYGGCKGNANKFRTRADCQRRCSVRDSCSQPRDEGNCTEKHSRWFFDRSENRCMPFYFTGCGGNRNNFDSRDACEADCPAKIEQDTCLLPALLGECYNYTTRWFYDSYEQRCRQFHYGGCGGNGNNFLTEQECSGQCQKSSSTPAPPTQVFKTEFCFLPNVRGPCTENLVKWFYDSRDGVCKQFQFSGCEGNGNRFDTREECDYRCGEVQDPCEMPRVVGPCNGFVKQFYYERRTDTCEEFEYSGCGGNKNRFEDQNDCENKCRRTKQPQRHNETTATESPPTQVLPTSAICLAPVEPGPCDQDITAYYYDAERKSCQAFIYGGCQGNANRFQTEEQCERLCGRFQGQDVCNVPHDSGPCRGAFPKIFYDPSSRTCREFIYGGCDGNANRFSTVPECESVCLHREEPTPAGNDTALTHLEICREPVDVGSCATAVYKRFYFDEDRQDCMPFIYTGCGGNRNNFKTYEFCFSTCSRTSNEIDVDENAGAKNPCAAAQKECDLIRCPYGKEEFVDANFCDRCRCADPCARTYCPEGTKCSITLIGTPEGTEYRGVCRSTTKPGNCPSVSNSTRCEHECSTDADCHGETKCCDNGCGTSCLEPAPQEPPTTLPPIFNVTVPSFAADAATIRQPEEPRITGEEGGLAEMRCDATGNPRPTITWRRDTTVINSAEKRRRILPDGTLQIVNLYSYDRGTYVCTADNGLAPPARIEYQLEVTEPREDRATAIVGEPQAYTTVTMNSPTILHCYAIGWPRPAITWWRGTRMLPLSSAEYEQDSDSTLLIRTVTLTNLGVYTCQAFNGIKRPASWSITLQAIGPVLNVRPDQQEYTKYLVQAPKRPERPSTDRPQYPYRPIRTRAPANQTYAPINQSVAPPRRRTPVPRIPYTSPNAIPLTAAPPIRPNRYQVPVSVNVTTDQTEYPVGSDVSLGCSVDGYPIPRVLWYKNNELVRSDDRIKISESNRLMITNAVSEDSGTYRCEATNALSTSSATVEIRVEGLFIHPDCQDNDFFADCHLIVKANYCKHKYYAKFCCKSCTEAGQLPLRGPHLNAAKKRRRRSIMNHWFV